MYTALTVFLFGNCFGANIALCILGVGINANGARNVLTANVALGVLGIGVNADLTIYTLGTNVAFSILVNVYARGAFNVLAASIAFCVFVNVTAYVRSLTGTN